MESAQFRDDFVPGTQIEMIGVGKDESCTELFEIARRHTFDGSGSANGCEDRRRNIAVRGVEDSSASTVNLSKFFVGEDSIGHG